MEQTTTLTPESLAFHFTERGLNAEPRDNFTVVSKTEGHSIALFINEDELYVIEYKGVRRNHSRNHLGKVQLCDHAGFDKLIDLVVEKIS